MAVRSYHDLTIWQDGIWVTKTIYEISSGFPNHELFGLTNQLRRAAVSIPSNIAEGHIQDSDAVFARHLQIAIGSAAEIDTQLLIAQQLGYINLEQMQTMRDRVTSLLRRMRSLHKKLTQAKKP